MGLFIRKERGDYHVNGIAKLSIICLLVSLAAAFVDTVWAVYLDSFFHSEIYVGFFSAFLTIVSFASYFLFIPLIEKKNKAKLFVYSLYLSFITYILFALNKNFSFMIALSIIMTLVYTLRITSFGIIIKDKSIKKKLSITEGVMYTLRNVGWVIGPLLAGYILSFLGMEPVFILAAVILFTGIVIFKISGIKDSHIIKKADTNIIKNFFDFFKDKNRIIPYLLSGGVSLWWGFIYIFIPLEIVRSGLNELWIGYFLFAIAVPLIICEYPFSKWAGNHGFRKLFKIGFFVVAVFSLICFFIFNIYAIMVFLVLASFGMAMIEPTIEAYFFDSIRGENSYRFYGPYNTAIDVGHFIGKISVSLLLIFLPFKFTFLLMAGFMLILFLLSFKTKEIVEMNKKNETK